MRLVSRGYTSISGHDRKHWERISVHHGERPWKHHIKFKVKCGERWVVMIPPSTPLKGTVMVGEMSGYYEPEWDEKTAWEALLEAIDNHFTDWNESGRIWLGPRIDTPTRIFAAAHEAIAARAGESR
ncbi:protein of unknown function [Burkholderia multivorans]